jgi:hypothetical protein
VHAVTFRGRARIVTNGIGLAFAADPVFAGRLSTKEERRKRHSGRQEMRAVRKTFFPATTWHKRAAQRIERGEADHVPSQARRSPSLAK